jgi:hypothetical protein
LDQPGQLSPERDYTRLLLWHTFDLFVPDLTRLLIIWGAVDHAMGECHESHCPRPDRVGTESEHNDVRSADQSLYRRRLVVSNRMNNLNAIPFFVCMTGYQSFSL